MSVQDRCMVCTGRSIGLEIILDAPDYHCVMRLKWKLVLALSDIVLILTQDSMVCVERTIGSAILLDAPDGTPR